MWHHPDQISFHTMIGARDLQEYYLLPERTLQFWNYWLQWTDQHREEVRNSIPFFTEHNWSLMKLNGIDGFLFLFQSKLFSGISIDSSRWSVEYQTTNRTRLLAIE